MEPSGPDPNIALAFYLEALVWMMKIFLGTTWTAFAIYCVWLFRQWLLPQHGNRAMKSLECGGEYEQHEIP
jgi:hypothetical protein